MLTFCLAKQLHKNFPLFTLCHKENDSVTSNVKTNLAFSGTHFEILILYLFIFWPHTLSVHQCPGPTWLAHGDLCVWNQDHLPVSLICPPCQPYQDPSLHTS